MVRMYDLGTLKAYVTPQSTLHHKAAVTSVQYAPTATSYASGSVDGSIKIWDTVSNNCIKTIDEAHGGRPVTSVCYSSDGGSLLTYGKDSIVRLWDIGTCQMVQEFKGASQNVCSKKVC
jgi:cleavage stimulation factor subunit 1